MRVYLLLLFSFVLAFFAGFITGIVYVAHFSGKRASVYLVAVKTGADEGTLVELVGELRPGSGRVLLSTLAKTEPDTEESAEIAVSVARRLAGRVFPFEDVVFTIEEPDAIVGGPSAGAAMTVLAYALFTDKVPRKDVVVTGGIDATGALVPVGGVVEKLQAAAREGIRVFIIPSGNRYEKVGKPVLKKVTPFPGVSIVEQSVEWKTVDVVALGEEYGVKVVVADRIEDVLPYFFSG